jgi:hypothetical protein
MSAPTHADILAAFAKMDTLAAADLISDLFTQTLANATDDEATALCEVWLGGKTVHSVEDALAEAVCNLRDHREDYRSSYAAERAQEAAEYRYKLDREMGA